MPSASQRQSRTMATNLLPGGRTGNALNGLVTRQRRAQEAQPNSQQHAQNIAPRQQAEAQRRRRARLAAQLQADAQRSGRGALSENEVTAALRGMGVD